MILDKLQNHIRNNVYVLDMYRKGLNINKLPLHVQKSLKEMESLGKEYVIKNGSLGVGNDILFNNCVFQKGLLIELGFYIKNKKAFEKTSNYYNNKDKKISKEMTGKSYLENKSIKDMHVKIQFLHLQRRIAASAGIDGLQLQANDELNFQNRLSSEDTKMMPKKFNVIKMKIAMDSFLKRDKLELDIPGLQLDEDIEYTNTPEPTVVISEEQLMLQMNAVAQQQYHLKEVAAKTLEMSLDGDIPRAIITDLSYQQIHGIVESIEKRFNNVQQGPTKVQRNIKKVGQVQNNNLAPKVFPIKPASLDKKIQKVQDKMRVSQLANKMVAKQDSQSNYIDKERFELDEMQGKSSVYEAGARNPLSGRLFSVKIKTVNSDLRYDDRFKRYAA